MEPQLEPAFGTVDAPAPAAPPERPRHRNPYWRVQPRRDVTWLAPVVVPLLVIPEPEFDVQTAIQRGDEFDNLGDGNYRHKRCKVPA